MGSRIMTLVLLGLFALMLYLFIRLMARASAWMTGMGHRPYRLLASRYRGRFERRGFGDPPTVSFTHNGSSVRVGLAPQVGGKPLPPRTRVVVKFPRGLPIRLELAPVSRPAPPQPPRGTRLVHVGDLEFDHAYVVQANDIEMARAFLSSAVRWSIAKLTRLGPPGGMLISVNPQRLLVQVDRNLGLNGDALGQRRPGSARDPRRPLPGRGPATERRDRHRRRRSRLGRGRRAARSARSAARRSSTIPASSAAPARRPITATAGSSSAPARSMAATASGASRRETGTGAAELRRLRRMETESDLFRSRGGAVILNCRGCSRPNHRNP